MNSITGRGDYRLESIFHWMKRISHSNRANVPDSGDGRLRPRVFPLLSGNESSIFRRTGTPQAVCGPTRNPTWTPPLPSSSPSRVSLMEWLSTTSRRITCSFATRSRKVPPPTKLPRPCLLPQQSPTAVNRDKTYYETISATA